jgi:predicted transcriptional regulator
MRRRSRLEIYFKVLEVIQRGVDKPTRIMYGSNLSWNAIQEVFEVLVAGGFVSVKKQGKKSRYHITDKGHRAITYYKRSLEDLINPQHGREK